VSTPHTPRPVSSRSTYLLAAVALAVIGVVVGLMLAHRSPDRGTTVHNQGYGSAHNPAVRVTLEPDGVQLLGLPTAAKTVDIYEDPLCPSCGDLETGYGQQLAQSIDQGKLAIRYHLVNFLDKKSASGDYSSRAISAFRCLAQTGDCPIYAKFHAGQFTTDQPTEGGTDHTNQQLADLARSAGAGAAAVHCVASGSQLEPARAFAAAAMKALAAADGGQAATPTVMSGTSNVDLDDEEWAAKLAS